jgi:hypothetical protein
MKLFLFLLSSSTIDNNSQPAEEFPRCPFLSRYDKSSLLSESQRTKTTAWNPVNGSSVIVAVSLVKCHLSLFVIFSLFSAMVNITVCVLIYGS